MHPNGEVSVNGANHEPETNGDAVANGQHESQTMGLAGEKLPNTVRITTPYLTKYERARVLGTRALQIRCVIAVFCSVLFVIVLSSCYVY